MTRKVDVKTERLAKLTDQYYADEARRDKSYRALLNEIHRVNGLGMGIGRIAPVVRMSKAHVGRICAAGRRK